jgi:hypothetical protein
MSAYQFIKLNSQYIQNIDGCLTEDANITLYKDGKLQFYWFEYGELVNSKMGH